MKRGTANLVKFKRLQVRLQMPVWQVKGLLQSLWDLAAENAIYGDVGKYSDEDLCLGMDYTGEPRDLIQALVECGWLDRDERSRLRIHDWFDHCEDWIRKRILRERGEKATWAEFVEKWTADNGGRGVAPGPPPSRSGSQQPPPSADGGQRQPPSDNGSERQPVADNGGHCPTTAACHSLGHSHSLSHSPEVHPPNPPQAGGVSGARETQPPANGTGHRVRRREDIDPDGEPARMVSAWYAERQGNDGAPATPPSPAEVRLAEQMLPRIRAADPVGDPEAWGRGLARHVYEHTADPRDPEQRSFVAAAKRLDGFIHGLARDRRYREERAELEAERERCEEHEREHAEAYLDYLQGAYDRLCEEHPGSMAEWTKGKRNALKGRLGREPTREEFLREFLAAGKQRRRDVLDFWQWDAQLNPSGLEVKE